MVIVSIRVAFLTLSKRFKNKIFILFQPFRDAFRGSLGSNGLLWIFIYIRKKFFFKGFSHFFKNACCLNYFYSCGL